MAPQVVHIHIGSTKTGTTYVQRVLEANRQRLIDDGVLLPGRRQSVRTQAVRELKSWNPTASPEPPPSWRQLNKQIARWSGESVIISQEFLCWLTQEQAKAMVASLQDSKVHVILSTRDLARLIPAQWQSAMRQRNSWTLTEYAAAVTGEGPEGKQNPAYQHFWKRQDYGSILGRWAAAVGPENLSVVTLPPSGTDPEELWRRFSQATGLSPERYDTGSVRNASLGATSSEVMRRLNANPALKPVSRQGYGEVVNGKLSRKVLDHRRPQEAGLSLPDAQREWAEHTAESIIADIEKVGPRVIGDLNDLRPRPSTRPYQAPEQIPAEDLLAAAIDSLAGLVAIQAQRKVKKAQRSTTTKHQRRQPQPRYKRLIRRLRNGNKPA